MFDQEGSDSPSREASKETGDTTKGGTPGKVAHHSARSPTHPGHHPCMTVDEVD